MKRWIWLQICARRFFTWLQVPSWRQYLLIKNCRVCKYQEHVGQISWQAQHWSTLWLLAAFSVAKNHFAWQMQYFSTLWFFSVANAAFSGSCRVAYAALEACYQKVARSCKKTCNRNVLRRFKKLEKYFLCARRTSWLSARVWYGHNFWIATWSPVVARCELWNKVVLSRGGHFDRNVVSRCGAVRILTKWLALWRCGHSGT